MMLFFGLAAFCFCFAFIVAGVIASEKSEGNYSSENDLIHTDVVMRSSAIHVVPEAPPKPSPEVEKQQRFERFALNPQHHTAREFGIGETSRDSWDGRHQFTALGQLNFIGTPATSVELVVYLPRNAEVKANRFVFPFVAEEWRGIATSGDQWGNGRTHDYLPHIEKMPSFVNCAPEQVPSPLIEAQKREQESMLERSMRELAIDETPGNWGIVMQPNGKDAVSVTVPGYKSRGEAKRAIQTILEEERGGRRSWSSSWSSMTPIPMGGDAGLESKAKATVIDDDADHGALIEDRGKFYLHVRCTTKKTLHILEVPPLMKTAKEARAWTFDVNPEIFEPKKET